MSKSLHVLVLEPFGGGSHATFYRGWAKFSRHSFTVLELPPNHWKWRSRHAAFSFAEQAMQLKRSGAMPDAVFCSSMLELPVWRGLVDSQLASRPAIAYFHENQFTYPLSEQQQRDYHYAYSNLLTAIASEQVWFNSDFHRNEFYAAANYWLRRMPGGNQHLESLSAARDRSVVRPPGFQLPTETGHSSPKVARDDSLPVIGWVARWEHDKAPERFVEALGYLIESGFDFQLCLLGERSRNPHPALAEVEAVAGERIVFNGYAETVEEYWNKLRAIDIVVSTARHEFFGIAVVEALAAGAVPIVPRTLAYPEVLQLDEFPERQEHFYDPAAEPLQDGSLESLLEHHLRSGGWRTRSNLVDRAREFLWQNLASSYDTDLEKLVG
ncbi:MAG: DUF3524 domain-containing protein [Aureliella sp.]